MAGKRKRREPSASTPSSCPPEIWSAILERLDARSLANARLVCREWRALATPLVRPARVREFLIEPIATLRGCDSSRAISIAPWAGMFATTHAGDAMRLWNSVGECVFVSNHFMHDAFGLGDALVSVSATHPDYRIDFWKKGRAGPKLRSGVEVGCLERFRTLTHRMTERWSASYAVIKPWNNRLVVALSNGDVETWDERGAVLSRMIGHSSKIRFAVAMGERLATVAGAYDVRIWNEAGACVSILNRCETGRDLNFAERCVFRVLAWGERVAVAYGDDLVRAWTDSTEYLDLFLPRSAAGHASMFAWGGRIVTRARAGRAHAWDEFGNRSTHSLNVDAFSHSTHGLLAFRDSDAIRVWDVPE